MDVITIMGFCVLTVTLSVIITLVLLDIHNNKKD